MVHTVFVCGSLKQGFINSGLMNEACYLGTGVTRHKDYYMISLGAYAAILKQGKHAISGELYQIDDKTLHQLDLLEEHPNVYCREQLNVVDIKGNTVRAWCYIFAR